MSPSKGCPEPPCQVAIVCVCKCGNKPGRYHLSFQRLFKW